MTKSVDWSDHISVGEFIVRNALLEDSVQSDITTDALEFDRNDLQTCMVVPREGLIVAGWFLVNLVFDSIAMMFRCRPVECVQYLKDGSSASSGESLGYLRGSAGVLLRGERVALNLLSHLSGIATLTSKYVHEVQGTGVEILDTRKTTPCLRALEKYAVRVGGGVNHRFDLSELAMIKDNHISVAGGAGNLHTVIMKLRKKGLPVEIEVDSLDQLRCVLLEKPERILLDNMTPGTLREAVGIASGSGCYLEASGGITLKNIRVIAETGVDGISSGTLTHSAESSDIGFDWKRK